MNTVRTKKRYEAGTIKQAEGMRAAGLSYQQISHTLGIDIPKSTLSTWLGHKYPVAFDRKLRLEHLAKIRALATESKRNERKQRENILKERVTKEISGFPLGNRWVYKSILASLYWAEGAKHDGAGCILFTNTDPLLSKLFITLLRQCYRLDESKFRLRLHLHYYHSIKNCKRFWSKLLNIPTEKIGKIYIKKRSKTKRFRQNFMGICFIKYHDKSLLIEIIELGRQLGRKIVGDQV